MRADTLDIIATIDVRGKPCTERKAAIFGLYASLDDNEAFEFINDHDPAPLRGVFDAIAPDGYAWTYVEQGPDAWRVRISRSLMP
ncbi:MAG: DUF2249 domain-containing protein [Ancalomicrobiaceae bacterium]|nr:DUF2249 domain-containing protein [Ancalomicrobiaceae bacterium]